MTSFVSVEKQQALEIEVVGFRNRSDLSIKESPVYEVELSGTTFMGPDYFYILTKSIEGLAIGDKVTIKVEKNVV